MKVIHESDYKLVGTIGTWYMFESLPKPNFDPEMILVKRVRMIKADGKSVFFDPIKKVTDSKRVVERISV